PAIHETVSYALGHDRLLHLAYLVPSRDEQTERDVDPIRLVTAEGRIYLEAWCRRAEDVRLFRLDRIVSADVLDEAAADHTDTSRDLSAGLFQPSPDAPEAVLDLAPNAHWIIEQYAVETLREQPDGTVRVRMRAGDLEWLRRFVLRQGGEIGVVAPQELADQVVRSARSALAAYDGG
ncbi:MAG: helix-turn-helix transcriptional regulator, partial [Nocardioidaceae bacterium]